MEKLLFLVLLSILILKAFCSNEVSKEKIYQIVDDYILEKYGKGLNYMYTSYFQDDVGKPVNLKVVQLINGYYIPEVNRISVNPKDYSITGNLEFVLNGNERYVEGEEPMSLEEFLQFFIDTKFGGQYKADLSKYTVEEGGEDSRGMPHYYTLSNVDFIDNANLGYKNNKLTVFVFYERVPGYTDLYELYYYAGIDYREKDCAGNITYGVFAYTREVKVDELFCNR
ncbi:hypothetical protein BCR36DRAFT_310490 [Piromyces finnis]|uniref:Uncharacterized protein n=1 Tax=Piromyces finnis TaxID=1754191 RepID=A0A1Y1UUH5_9FUNG|nr:hypothetical protein BCR36DRAFT_310490 [Piromyces finnis]|eukprot:ORX41606.1 hypothetical protein BCR36DRAFT_310490 [Piromyces finnis]